MTNGSGITGTGTALTNHNRSKDRGDKFPFLIGLTVELPSLIDLLGSNCTERIERGSAEGHLIEDYLLRSGTIVVVVVWPHSHSLCWCES